MLSRRNLRVKTLQNLFAFEYAKKTNTRLTQDKLNAKLAELSQEDSKSDSYQAYHNLAIQSYFESSSDHKKKIVKDLPSKARNLIHELEKDLEDFDKLDFNRYMRKIESDFQELSDQVKFVFYLIFYFFKQASQDRDLIKNPSLQYFAENKILRNNIQ